MKYQLFLLFLMFITISSCNLSDDVLDISYEAVSIDSVQMPQEFSFGQQHDIAVYYNRPTDCHFFEGFNVEAHLNERTVAVVMSKLSNGTCNDEFEPEEQVLKFTASSNGTYVFKFLTLQDINQDGLGPDYMEYEVPVVE